MRACVSACVHSFSVCVRWPCDEDDDDDGGGTGGGVDLGGPALHTRCALCQHTGSDHTRHGTGYAIILLSTDC